MQGSVKLLLGEWLSTVATVPAEEAPVVTVPLAPSVPSVSGCRCRSRLRADAQQAAFHVSRAMGDGL